MSIASIVGAVTSCIQSILFAKKHFVLAAGMSKSIDVIVCDARHQARRRQ